MLSHIQTGCSLPRKKQSSGCRIFHTLTDTSIRLRCMQFLWTYLAKLNPQSLQSHLEIIHFKLNVQTCRTGFLPLQLTDWTTNLIGSEGIDPSACLQSKTLLASVVECTGHKRSPFVKRSIRAEIDYKELFLSLVVSCLLFRAQSLQSSSKLCGFLFVTLSRKRELVCGFASSYGKRSQHSDIPCEPHEEGRAAGTRCHPSRDVSDPDLQPS